MVNMPKTYLVLISLALIIGLTGCELRRSNDDVSDLEPVSELSPTLAPLGSEESELTGEATAIPTVINVQPTATQSSLAGNEAADDPNELVAPTAQPVDLSTAPEASNNAVEGAAAVVPETFTPPEAEAQASIIADAPTEDLPSGGPIAANPPSSQTGDYGASDYGDTSYTVQSGDTLFGIGYRYGISAQAIMVANGLNSDIIQVGQVLTLPSGGETDYTPPTYEPSSSEDYANDFGGEYVVSPGETLYQIALQYGVSVDAIAGANQIPYPYIIQVGQPLIIPAPGANPGPPPPPEGGYYQPDPGYYPSQPNEGYPSQPNDGYYTPQPDQGYYPAPDNAYPVPGGANTHTVAPGETLFSIAQRYGLTAEAMAQGNGLANPNQIFVGQVLYLP